VHARGWLKSLACAVCAGAPPADPVHVLAYACDCNTLRRRRALGRVRRCEQAAE